jgi:hypothetical protein
MEADDRPYRPALVSMKRQTGFVKTAIWVMLFTLLPGVGAAQFSAGTSVSLASPYVFRGVTRSNGWNFQPELFVAGRIAGGFLTAGGWANLEAGSHSPGNLSDLGGTRSGFSEVDYWLQYARPLGEIEAVVGAVRYTFPSDAPAAARDEDDNTTEIYSAVQLSSTYLVPRLAAYLDVERVRGVYLEGGVTVPLLAYPFGNPIVFYASALAGYNLGQELNPDRPSQGANFRHDGFTHFDFSIRATLRPVKALPLSMNIEPHWQLKVDDFTRRTSPEAGDAERRLQFWLGVSISTGIGLP